MAHFLQVGCSSPHFTLRFLHGLIRDVVRNRPSSSAFSVPGPTYQHPLRLRRLGAVASRTVLRGIISYMVHALDKNGSWDKSCR